VADTGAFDKDALLRLSRTVFWAAAGVVLLVGPVFAFVTAADAATESDSAASLLTGVLTFVTGLALTALICLVLAALALIIDLVAVPRSGLPAAADEQGAVDLRSTDASTPTAVVSEESRT
jgi:hypothetical protein